VRPARAQSAPARRQDDLAPIRPLGIALSRHCPCERARGVAAPACVARLRDRVPAGAGGALGHRRKRRHLRERTIHRRAGRVDDLAVPGARREGSSARSARAVSTSVGLCQVAGVASGKRGFVCAVVATTPPHEAAAFATGAPPTPSSRPAWAVYVARRANCSVGGGLAAEHGQICSAPSNPSFEYVSTSCGRLLRLRATSPAGASTAPRSGGPLGRR
jgi:hypothetical protein